MIILFLVFSIPPNRISNCYVKAIKPMLSLERGFDFGYRIYYIVNKLFHMIIQITVFSLY
jgi:hypothetical protein